MIKSTYSGCSRKEAEAEKESKTTTGGNSSFHKISHLEHFQMIIIIMNKTIRLTNQDKLLKMPSKMTVASLVGGWMGGWIGYLWALVGLDRSPLL